MQNSLLPCSIRMSSGSPRPDCLPPDVIDLLDELNQQTFLWVELGVQTIHPETSAAMNLCYCVSDYDDAVCRLQARGIRVVSHLILGLPGETEDMMFAGARLSDKALRTETPHVQPGQGFPDGKDPSELRVV